MVLNILVLFSFQPKIYPGHIIFGGGGGEFLNMSTFRDGYIFHMPGLAIKSPLAINNEQSLNPGPMPC